MNNNKNNGKKCIIPISLIIIAIVSMLPVIISLIIAFLPVFLLGLFGLLVFAVVKHIFFKRKKKVETILPEDETAVDSQTQPENEFSITQKAFGLLQRRITEQLALEYPGARWVWSSPDTFKKFKDNIPLVVLLNGAGGYNKALVVVHNMLFQGMKYYTLDAPITAPSVIPSVPVINEIPGDADDNEDDSENTRIDISDGIVIYDDMPVNYCRLAFEWVDTNMMDIDSKYNEAISQNNTEMLIPAGDLPHPDSWTEVCAELKRNGFSVADFCEDGIKVNITN